MRSIVPALVVLTASLTLLGCGGYGSSKPTARVAEPAAPAVAVAQATIGPTQGNACRGTVTFTQDGARVKVVANLTGLAPGQNHAMHVHENGDCSAPDAMSAGSHYNPAGHAHGLPPAEPRHAGDLGNVLADADGKAHYEITVENLSIDGPLHPIVGRAVIVHAKPDDGGQPVGNAGGRIGCGVITRL